MDDVVSELHQETLREMGAFFAEGSKMVSINEFFNFWNSLTEIEKNQYLSEFFELRKS